MSATKLETLTKKKEALALCQLFFHPRASSKRVWAYQLPNGSYGPGSHPLTFGDVFAHFKGEKTLAAYLLDDKDNVKFIAIDIDLARSVVEPLLDKGLSYVEIFEKHKTILLEIANKLFSKLCYYFIRPYIAFSGSKGLHIYVFFENPVPAYRPVSLIRSILEKVSWPKDLVTVTPYPRQVTKGDGYGDIIKLPFGIHQVSRERTYFLNRVNGEPLNLLPSQIVKGPIDRLLKVTEHVAAELEERHELGIPQELPPKFLELMQKRPEVKALFEGRGKGYGDITRSGIDMTLLGIAINAGIADPNELAAIIALRPNAKVKDHPKPEAYLEKTVNKALEFFGSKTKEVIQNQGMRKMKKITQAECRRGRSLQTLEGFNGP
ncbi:TOTE conflict system archaeo-eukaryotic primase domain-containing protein [Candidatus Hadarchaeum sp.]|uniref:TOTE conflict system archaeo-eukaryotic primase domain-containing protein n=1 Tax=Candidatus Hadarchaeum sp. TaxID=2883567 RepID=UPI00319D964B